MRNLLAAVAVAVVLLPGVSARADGPASGLSTLAVQNRTHNHRHEFGLQVGVLPMDAFTKGITAGASYSFHFSELIGWEVVQAAYSFGVDTHLVKDLEALDVRPTPFERVEWYATSNFLFKPLYWKGAALNKSLMYGEMYLSAGGGLGRLTRSFRPVAEVGIGVRLYASELLSFRIDIRDMAFFTLSDFQNELWIGLGMSI
ncbi:MAG: outer membrane beta-barrel domain-containing protein [Deltaproteobacteria bacterium]|nr:outer membrane beta-barrel domain-containing protein [Deltaproteobacteria bacterium]